MNASPDYPLEKVCPDDMTMELRCIVIKPILLFLTDHFGKQKTASIVAETRMSMIHLENPYNWVSFEYNCRLLRKLVEVTGDAQAPFRATQQYTNTGSWSGLGQFLMSLGSPESSFSLAVRFNDLWNRISRWEMERSSSNKRVITVTFDKVAQDRNNCLAIQGFLSSSPNAFNLPYAQVTERQCACEGADSCIYDVSWVGKGTSRWVWIGTLGGAFVGVLFTLVPGSLFTILVAGLSMAIAGNLMGQAIHQRDRLKASYDLNQEQANSLLEAMRAREQLNEELQDLVKQRTAELRETNDQLQKALNELEETQEMRVQAERRAVVGVLAGGMAHDINSPVNAIRMSVHALIEDVGEDSGSPLLPLLQNVERATTRCMRIVHDLLTFSRNSTIPSTDSRIEKIVDAVLELFCREHPGAIFIKKDYAANLPAVFLDSSQIQQALLNILSNAADAMAGEGEIDVTLSATSKSVSVSIRDHGVGMREDDRGRIFEQFFTTKKGSGGLGMGLPISRELIKRNGGSIDVDSIEGDGSTFTIRFPLRDNTTDETGLPLNIDDKKDWNI